VSLGRAVRAAQLTVAEADKLLLAPMGHRYGLVSRRYRPWTSPRQLDRPNRWILVRTSQYCPSCLAGDGSPEEALNGGAWRRQGMTISTIRGSSYASHVEAFSSSSLMAAMPTVLSAKSKTARFSSMRRREAILGMATMSRSPASAGCAAPGVFPWSSQLDAITE
jgi:hypothetical protein